MQDFIDKMPTYTHRKLREDIRALKIDSVYFEKPDQIRLTFQDSPAEVIVPESTIKLFDPAEGDYFCVIPDQGNHQWFSPKDAFERECKLKAI